MFTTQLVHLYTMGEAVEVEMAVNHPLHRSLVVSDVSLLLYRVG